ncbi:HAMP domain-containing sensor histidine kinase [Dokdonella soli]|uniref:histidine kinase n=1 Tax=Dokdonella soli TaxID=529810 RepID=A0ABN1IS57_9GAMM
MSRLYLRFYLALLGSLLVFALAAGCIWHLFIAPAPPASGPLGRLLQNALPAADTPPAEQQAALQRLVAGLGADVTLIADDATPLARVGKPLPIPRREQAHSAATPLHAGAVWTIQLPDGRRLLASTAIIGGHQDMLLLILLVLALAVGIAALPVVRRLATRLERLQAGVESLGAGDLSTRVAVEGNDEVARLAESFNRAAERIDELVGAHKQLLANASHELRTPLTRIRLALELMKGAADPVRKRGLNQDIEELDRLIDEILLASRLDAVSETGASEEVDLLALAAEECSRYEEAELDGTPAVLRGDARLLRRLLRNLLENARRHGLPPTHVTVGRSVHGVTITVSDRGPAIPVGECEPLFAPFHRRAQAGDSSGTGLGLSLVRQIARRHGGDAQCEPTPDGHMRFVVTLADSH